MSVECNQICFHDEPNYAHKPLSDYGKCEEIQNYLGNGDTVLTEQFKKNNAYAETVLKGYCNLKKTKNKPTNSSIEKIWRTSPEGKWSQHENFNYVPGGSTNKKRRKRQRNTKKKRNRRSNKKK